MYTVIRAWQADEESIEASIEKVRETFVPQIRKLDGFQSYDFLEGEGGKIATISVFEDRKAAEESTNIARAFARDELQGVIQGPPELIEGEVRIHEAA